MIGRRSFLTGLGAGLCLPFLPWQRAAAQAGGAPKRLVVFFTPNGTIPESWATGSGANFTLGDILEPLEPFKQKLTLMDGLDMECTYEGPGGGHQRGIGALLTGRKLQPGDFVGGNGETSAGWADGISVDQHIANAMGSETRFASLALGVQLEGANNRHRMSMSGPGQPVPTEDDPYNIFDLVFSDMGASRQETERRLRRRTAALAHVRARLEGLRGRLSGDERLRVEAHQASLDDVVSRLGIDGGGPACVLPTLAAGLDVDDRAAYPEIGRVNMDLLYQALACDLTRVATLLWAGATSGHRFTFLEPAIDDGHHEISHDDSNAAVAKLVRINNWYAQQLAYFLDLLEGTPEGDGTMLDNTLVLWGSDLSIGTTHSRRDMHLVMAGNLAGAFDTGRYLHYDGRAHNDLLITILQAFGLTDTTFGKPDLCSGPIENLLA
jgi:hypothetical protein